MHLPIYTVYIYIISIHSLFFFSETQYKIHCLIKVHRSCTEHVNSIHSKWWWWRRSSRVTDNEGDTRYLVANFHFTLTGHLSRLHPTLTCCPTCSITVIRKRVFRPGSLYVLRRHTHTHTHSKYQQVFRYHTSRIYGRKTLLTVEHRLPLGSWVRGFNTVQAWPHYPTPSHSL